MKPGDHRPAMHDAHRASPDSIDDGEWARILSRGAPDVDPADCLPAMRGKGHRHEVLCATAARYAPTLPRAW